MDAHSKQKEESSPSTTTATATSDAESSLDPMIDRLPSPPQRPPRPRRPRPGRSQLAWPEDVGRVVSESGAVARRMRQVSKEDGHRETSPSDGSQTALTHEQAHAGTCPIHGRASVGTSPAQQSAGINASPSKQDDAHIDTSRSHRATSTDDSTAHTNPDVNSSSSNRTTHVNNPALDRSAAPLIPSPAWINQTMFRKYIAPTPPSTPGGGTKRSRFSVLSFGHWPRANLNLSLNYLGGGGDGGGSPSPWSAASSSDARPEKDTTNFGDLFFDLLFAANLDVYTEAVSLDNVAQVGGFLGWFVVLWWTWYSHALFDVRYRHIRGDTTHSLNVVDSHTPRCIYNPLKSNRSVVPLLYAQLVSRLAQIGIWVCFMTTASNFGRGDYGSFSLVYAVNRLSLAADWAVVLLWKVCWEWRGRRKLKSCGNSKGDGDGTPDKLVDTLPPCPLSHGVSKRGELLSMIGALISAAIWFLSSHLTKLNTGHRFSMWVIATAVETLVLVWVETRPSLTKHHLGHTPICERLALFALVILGQGFVAMGQLLNSISPGLKMPSMSDPTRSIPQGGWDVIVVLNTCSAVLIICCAFVTYYRDADTQIRRKTVRRLTVLGWTAVHVLYFASAALLVVGLKRLLALQSVVSAFTRLILSPQDYLPNTPEYAQLTTPRIEKLISNYAKTARLDQNTTLLSLDLDTPEAGVLAMVSVIEGFQGASIPSVDLARALVRSAIALQSPGYQQEDLLNSNAALRVQLLHYSSYLETIREPTSIRGVILDGLFQFKYVYLAVSVIYTCDVVIKGVLDGWTAIRREKWPSLSIRLGMACVLGGVQGIYLHFKLLPSWIALAGGLPILALLMVFEIALQALVEWIRWALAVKRARRENIA